MRMKGVVTQRFCAASAAAVIVGVGGCGGPAFSTVPVSGKITYEDGSPIPAKSIQLRMRSLAAESDPEISPRVGMVDVDVSDGTITGGITYVPGDGVIKGKHKFSISIEPPPGKRPLDLVPRDYISAETSPLTVDTADMPWHIKIPKP